MQLIDIILIAIGLAMDCFAVSIASGISYPKECNTRNVIRMAILFGVFQAAMPLVGWALSVRFANMIAVSSRWVALIILGLLGAKMIYTSLVSKEENSDSPFGSLKLLFFFSIATSIDALATGLVFVPYTMNTIFLAILLIGIASLIFSLLGAYLGKHFGSHIKLNAELIGGIILIGIGLKIFFCA